MNSLTVILLTMLGFNLVFNGPPFENQAKQTAMVVSWVLVTLILSACVLIVELTP